VIIGSAGLLHRLGLSDVLPSEIGCDCQFDISRELVIVSVDGLALVDTASEHSMSKKSSVPPEHDREARDRIRNRLLHYMREHGIGAPELTVRIYNAQEPKQLKPVGISTVQRFLANKVRTVESYVDMFERFVEKFPSPDLIGALGKAMAEFYVSDDADRFAGDYQSAVAYEMDDSRDGFNSSLAIKEDNKFCRVVERSEDRKSLICEGVLVCNDQTAIMTLHDKLTQVSRQFLLADDGEQISGCGTEGEFDPSPEKRHRQPALHFVSIKLTRIFLAEFVYAREEITVAVSDTISNEERYRRMLAEVTSRSALPRPAFDKDPLPRLTAMSSQQPEEPPQSDQGHPDERANQVAPDQSAFLRAAERGDETTVKRLLGSGADIDTADMYTGLTALHLAVGRNALHVVKFLVGQGASFVPDRLGRMPTTIAAECEVSDELCDFIVEAEAAAEARAGGV
jgi:hypothetical protein